MKSKTIFVAIIASFVLAVSCGCNALHEADNLEDATFQTVELENVSFEIPDTFTSETTEYTGITEVQINSINMSESPVSVTIQTNPSKSSPEQIMKQEETSKVERSGAKNWACEKVSSSKNNGARCVTYKYTWNDNASDNKKEMYRAIITNDQMHIDIQSKKYADLPPSSSVVNHIASSMKLS